MKKWNIYFHILFPSKSTVFVFVLSTFIIGVLLIMLPVWTTPGSDILFHVSTLDWYGLTLVIVLSLASGLLSAMQYEIRKQVRQARSLKHRVAETSTAIGFLVGAFASTVACTACYSSLLAFLGLGATAFLAKYRLWISFATLLIVAYSLYHSWRRLNNKCEKCQI